MSVHKSKFKNLLGTVCAKNQYYTNLNLVQTKNGNDSNIISANEEFFAIPWGSNSIFVGHRKNTKHKISSDPFLVNGHNLGITDSQFSPFASNILATSSIDATVKLWKLPNDDLKENIDKDICSLQHDKKINLFKFHPTVSDVLVSSSFDFKLRLWDINHPQEPVQTIGNHDDLVQSISWNNDGSAFVSSSRDKFARIIDPRAANVMMKGKVHESNKGFRTQWNLKNEDLFVTVGFSSQRKREISLWDMRKSLETSIQTNAIDDLPTLFWTYLDHGNNLLYLAGKGDNNIKFYEITNDSSGVNFLGEFKSQLSQAGVAMVPQRFNNVEKCEIGSFMKLTGKEIQTISVTVPRKESSLKMKKDDKLISIFQEDIYPKVPSGKPSLSSEQWFKGFDFPPDVVSLKTDDMISVYELSSEDGGKQRPEAESVFLRSSNEGFLFHINEKDPEKRDKFWISIKNREILLNQYSRKISKKSDPIPFSSVLAVHEAKLSDNSEEDNFGLQICTKEKMYYFMCESQKSRDHWISLMNKNIKVYYQNEKPLQATFLFAVKARNKIRGWNTRWIYYINDHLFFFSSRYSTIAQMRLYILDLKSVSKTPTVRGTHLQGSDYFYLEFTSKDDEKFLFKTNIESQRDEWFDYFDGLVEPDSKNSNHLMNLGLIQGREMNQTRIIVHPIPEKEKESEITSFFEKNFGTILSVKFYKGNKMIVGISNACLIKFERGESGQNAVDSNSITLNDNEMYIEPYIVKETPKPFYMSIKDIPVDFTIKYFKELFSTFQIDQMRLWHQPKNITDLSQTKSKLLNIKFSDIEEKEEAMNLKLENLMKISEISGRIDEDELFLNDINPTHVKNGKVLMLIQVKGKKRIRSRVVLFSIESLNSSDVFVLDAGMKIYQWNGKKSSKFKRARGLDVTTNLRVKERSGNAKAFIMDEGKDEDSTMFKEFWKLLTGQPKIQEVPLDNGITDQEEEETIDKQTFLYKITFQNGKCNSMMVSTNQLMSKDILTSDAVFVLDCFYEIHVWEGKNSDSESKKMAKQMAMKFESLEDRPFWITTTRHIEMAETVVFKEKFTDFPSALPVNVSASSVGMESSSNVSRKLEQKSISPDDLINFKSKEKQEIINDGNSSEIMIWKIEEFEKVKYPKEMYGRFFSGDCYIILYKYMKKNKYYYVVYFWQGSNSSKNDKGSSALLSVNLAENLQEENVQIRILQHQETSHFLSMFDTFIIHFGKHSDYEQNSMEVLEIRKSNTGAIRAIGIDKNYVYIHSNSVFIFKTNNEVVIRIGNHCTEEEIEYTKKVVGAISDKKLIINDESNDISSLLKKSFNVETVVSGSRNPMKLYHFFAQSGVVEYSEIYDFSQSNLNEEDVYVLHNGDIVYCWFGEKSSFYSRKFTLELAEKYTKKVEAKNLFVVKSKGEPIDFSILFQAWVVSSNSKVEKKLLNSRKILDEYQRTTYSYNQLLSDELPEGVDATKLETYLSEEEFVEIFKMEIEEFKKLPKHKQQNRKKEVYLF
eukprot:gene6648-10813_t